MDNIFPLTTNFRSYSYFNAFILNALATALIAALAIEFRLALDNRKSVVYKFVNGIFYGEELHEYQAFLTEFVLTFVVAFLVYQLLYVMFKFGGGMLIGNNDTYF